MKRIFQTGSFCFGAGRPGICVPIVDSGREEIWKSAEAISKLPADLAEWRADFYEDVWEERELLETLQGIRRRLGKKALLFTFRTDREGGNRPSGLEAYRRLNALAAASRAADLIDVELFPAGQEAEEAIREIHSHGVPVIASSHEFHRTPSKEEMVMRLKRMEELGADAAKLAVMPENAGDVLRLLTATEEADRKLEIPVVTMAMGRLGALSRISGMLTGSAMTFAAFEKASAPGQLSVDQVQTAWKILES